MTAIEKEDKLANAKAQGQACFDSIRKMVWALQSALAEGQAVDGDKAEEARKRIVEDPLSVEVRSDWYPLAYNADTKPAEYRILLCTGGPAVQIVGKLSEHCEPETAVMQVQAWFTPWTDFYPVIMDGPHSRDDAEQTLLAYARCFYFGE